MITKYQGPRHSPAYCADQKSLVFPHNRLDNGKIQCSGERKRFRGVGNLSGETENFSIESECRTRSCRVHQSEHCNEFQTKTVMKQTKSAGS